MPEPSQRRRNGRPPSNKYPGPKTKKTQELVTVSEPASETEMMDISLASELDITLNATMVNAMEASYKGDPVPINSKVGGEWLN